MLIEGNIWKDNQIWLIEIPILDLMTQGRSKTNALFMLKDAIKLLLNQKRLKLKTHIKSKNCFLLEVSEESGILPLILKRQRLKHKLSLSEIRTKLKTRSKNTYAQYEQGRNLPSLKKLQDFLTAMNGHLQISLGITSV